MTEQVSDSGVEVVLDNRKLVVAFLVLIAICGCFYVIGFIEGKRQGYQEGMQLSAEAAGKNLPAAQQAAVTETSETNPPPVTVRESVQEQRLDWYKSVNRRAAEVITTPSIIAPRGAEEPAAQAPPPAEKPKASIASQPTGSVTYTVQVGAFRQRSEAEIKARMLQAKGFDCRIEPPESAGQLYLVKVGKFKSRAEAVAMQLRLKKSGFDSFIKTN